MTDEEREHLNRWLDGEADATQVTALLERDPEAVRWLTSRAALVSDLQQSLARRKLQAMVQFPVSGAPQGSTRKRNGLRICLALIGAAAALVAGLMLYSPRRDDQRDPAGVPVEVVAAENTSDYWKGGGSRAVGELELATGHLTVRLDRGVLLDIFAPARLTMEGGTVVRLQSGKITADVGALGKGFTIVTPQTRVVDLGTVFGVDAGNGDSTDVVVFSGEVELHDDAPVETLTRGEAVRITKADGRKRIASVTTSRRRAEWSTAPPPADCAITAVSDDAERGAERFSYHITPGGLLEGAKAYVELPYEFRDVPTSLKGADLVQTFRGARKSLRFAMQVTLGRPAALYVLFDKSSASPEWLEQDFKKTGDTISLVSPDPASRRTVTLEIWRRDVSATGPVTLGPAREDRDGRGLMYVLAAMPLK